MILLTGAGVTTEIDDVEADDEVEFINQRSITTATATGSNPIRLALGGLWRVPGTVATTEIDGAAMRSCR